ncbi:MAG: hypothetical protein LBF95_03705 [Treponema sp.]|jgi:hypothetical protein|nr:hypothetical protein [Treponema sp.]
MNLPQRTIVSLTISVIIFAAFSLLAFTNVFDLVETRFYSPRIVRTLNHEVEDFTKTIADLLDDLRDRFAGTLENEAVQRSFLPNQEAEDIFERSRLYGLLMNSLPGLRTIRFVDAGGSRIHFSTLADDVLTQTGSSLSYRSYRDCPEVLPYTEVETPEGQPFRIIFNSSEEQLIFSYPFSDSLDVYRGSALFTLSVQGFTGPLIRQGQLKVGESIAVVDSPNGFLLGLPAAETGNLKREAAAAWQEDLFTLFIPDYAEVEPLTLVSAKSESGFFVGRLVQENVLVLPPTMRFILLASFFLTTFLVVFLVFNLRQDSLTVIRTRLKQLQISLIRQYYDTKGDMDWRHWIRELEQRREDVRLEIKRGLPQGKNRDIDALIDRSWDELIALTRPSVEFDEEKIRSLVRKTLQETAPDQDTAGASPLTAVSVLPLAGRSAEPEGELEELEGLEEIEELPAAVEAEETDVVEHVGGKDSGAESRPTPGETIVTPEAFETVNGDETVTELEPLEEAPAPVTEEDLATLASRIEFGPDLSENAMVLSTPDNAEAPRGEGTMDLSSPFDTLSFETPDFTTSPDAAREAGVSDKKKQRGGGEGLEELTETGGLPLVYQPFQFRENKKPAILRPLPEPGEGPIQEHDGIHLINSDILDPTLETTRKLDPKFLHLVESIIGRE